MMARKLITAPRAIIMLSFCTLAISQVWLSHLRYEGAKDFQKLTAEKQQIAGETTRLNLEIANITRPERLRQVAIAKLGMQPPGPMQVVRP